MNHRELAVEIHDLRFAWTAEQPLLQIRRLAVGRTERLFLQGASGSGKSTLLAIIGGVLSAGAGSVKVLNQNLNELSGAGRDAFRADRIGFIFQMFNLLPYLTVLENVTMPCRFSARRRTAAENESGSIEAEARRLLSKLGLSDEALIARTPMELSIGQQQRAAAARALIGRPDLIIADEPTSSLDADAREDFIDLLNQECAAAGTAVVFVSHDQSLGRRFDRTITLGDINA
jgi:putative ABC transport system ATP-binding protein